MTVRCGLICKLTTAGKRLSCESYLFTRCFAKDLDQRRRFLRLVRKHINDEDVRSVKFIPRLLRLPTPSLLAGTQPEGKVLPALNRRETRCLRCLFGLRFVLCCQPVLVRLVIAFVFPLVWLPPQQGKVLH